MQIRFSLAAIVAALFLAGTAFAQDFAWAPDFPEGTALPPISAADQNGEIRTFDELAGGNGMLFMLSRSFDW